MADIEARLQPFGKTTRSRLALHTGWKEVDSALGGGLASGAIHEWFGQDDVRGRGWVPPLAILIHLARQANQEPGHWTVWVGRRCWAYPPALIGDRTFLARSLLIDPACLDERTWAIELALRCPAVAAVVADGSGLKLTVTRRLQLAAADGGTTCFLARPSWEADVLSAAKTRWRVQAACSEDHRPRWTVELLRCKGMQPGNREGARWPVRLDHETGDVSLVAAVGERCDPAERSTERRIA